MGLNMADDTLHAGNHGALLRNPGPEDEDDSAVVVYHVTDCSKRKWVVEKMLTYGNRLRFTHCTEALIDTT